MSEFDNELKNAKGRVEAGQAARREKQNRQDSARAPKIARDKENRQKYKEEMLAIYDRVAAGFQDNGYHMALDASGNIEIFRHIGQEYFDQYELYHIKTGQREPSDPNWELRTYQGHNKGGEVNFAFWGGSPGKYSPAFAGLDRRRFDGSACDFGYVETVLANYLAYSQVHGEGEANAARTLGGMQKPATKNGLTVVFLLLVAIVVFAVLA